MNYRKLAFSLCWLCLLTCCSGNLSKESPMDTEEFILQAGFQIDEIAAEPLIYSPVTMTFDDKGRIWAVEMTGYMRTIEGTGEDIADGKIVILEDEDGDGKMDQRKVFLDSLVLPRALAFANGGLLYAEPPNLWWVDIKDDQPGERVLVDSMYTYGGNIEHMPNGLMYNLDNWIYNAKSTARYRYQDQQWHKEATTHRGQWGMSHDEMGRLIYNSNSSPLLGDHVLPNTLTANPYLKSVNAYNKPLTLDRRFFPIQPTTINRGYQEGNLDEEQKAKTFTSACGPLLYLGDQFPADYYGNAFVCGPEANLVKRYILSEQKGRLSAKPAYDDEEFLVSKDETFRPVNLFTGPDGAMYIVDMRKGVIQHRAYMSSYYQEEMIKKGLDELPPRGRIYRVSSKEEKSSAKIDLQALQAEDWVSLLQNKNVWYRDRAQRYLVENHKTDLLAQIENVALDTKSPAGQMHALWTLEGREELSITLLEKVSMQSKNPQVIATGVRLSEMFSQQQNSASTLEKIYSHASAMGAPVIDLQLCHSLGKIDAKFAKKMWLQLASTYHEDALFSEALISGIQGKENEYLKALPRASKGTRLYSTLEKTIENTKNDKNQAPQLQLAERVDGRTMAMNLYNSYCGTCHGFDGKGIENLAPPLYNSQYVEDGQTLITIALNGLQGPITVDGKEYVLNAVMPGVKYFPELDDAKLSRLLNYVRNAFVQNQKGSVSQREVARIREATKDRTDLFTAEELEKLIPGN